MGSKTVMVLVNSQKTLKYDDPSGKKETRYAHTPKLVYDALMAITREQKKTYLPQMVVFDPKVQTKLGKMSYDQLESGEEAYKAIHKMIAIGLKKAAP